MSASKTNGSTTPAWLIAIRPSRSTRTVRGISLKWHGSTRGRRQASPRRLRHELRTLSTSTRPTPERLTCRQEGRWLQRVERPAPWDGKEFVVMDIVPAPPTPGAFLKVNELILSRHVDVLDALLSDTYNPSAGSSNSDYLARRLVHVGFL
jgi:hypothetical protein